MPKSHSKSSRCKSPKKQETCSKAKVCFSAVSPVELDVDCTANQFTVALQAFGTTRNLPSGTTITLQYTRKYDRKTAVLIGTTTTDNFGNWTFNIPSLVVNTPSLGNINLFAQAFEGATVLGFGIFKIKVRCNAPPFIPVPGPYPCLCCTKKGCSSK